MKKQEIITRLDQILELTAPYDNFCAFCRSKETKFRINKYRFCEKDWEVFNLLKDLIIDS